MKRKVHVISIQEEYLNIISKQLIEVLGDSIEVSSLTIKNLDMNIISADDIVILSKEILKGITRPFIPLLCPIIIAKREINIVNTKELIRLPSRQKVLVVNDTLEHAKETAFSLENIYFEHDYFVDDGVNSIPASIDLIVTPGEMQLVPNHFTNVIDIGPRILDYHTFLKLTKLLDENYDQQHLMNRFMKSQVSLAKEFVKNPEENTSIKNGQIDLHNTNKNPLERPLNLLSEERNEYIIRKIEEHGFIEESLKILELYEERKKKFQSFGRMKLKLMLESSGFHLSEQQVRIRVEALQKLGLLIARQGRGGTTITTFGEKFLENREVVRDK
ncbi:winged-helix domain-containing protein [Paenisporosarcina sp. OV554]|uniref:winged-helix domain-containing protein n=1 Tax=Paenisporosarcina sp. OV554 TaxID=2135694 RepID=UPI0011B1D289|nr:winged-helix domain-containing protein [Paenisporosarcina sp. OV554]